MKKKLILLPLMLLSLTACNNGNYDKNIFMNNEDYTFTKVHIYRLNKCLNVKTWFYTNNDLIQFKLQNETIIKLSNKEFCQIEGKCPFCESEQ